MPGLAEASQGLWQARACAERRSCSRDMQTVAKMAKCDGEVSAIQSLRRSCSEEEPALRGAVAASEKQPRSMHDARAVMCCHASSPARYLPFSATACVVFNCAAFLHNIIAR